MRLAGGSAAGERPLRAQLVIGGVLALILVAVPLYLLRRPERAASMDPSDASASARGFGNIVLYAPDAGVGSLEVRLGPVQRVRCGSSAQSSMNEGGLCDGLPAFERALGRAIRNNIECAPRTGQGGTINFVLEVDFERQRLNAFAGKSGTWKGRQARTAARCVLRALGPIDWQATKHQYRYYAIAILATYPAPDPMDVLPTFE